jgi:hypothetical protein
MGGTGCRAASSSSIRRSASLARRPSLPSPTRCNCRAVQFKPIRARLRRPCSLWFSHCLHARTRAHRRAQ